MWSGRRWLLLLALAVLIVVIVILNWPPPAPGRSTKLIIEITGGFAYVPTPADRLLEIAYLNDVKLQEDTNSDGKIDAQDAVVCDVDQIGTELMVLRGVIVDSDPKPAPPTRIFNLDKAVVTIPALDTVNIPLKIGRTVWPPNPAKPSNPNAESEWHDLQYVPSTKEHLSGSALKRTWRGEKEVNGRMVLRGGTITGTFPSDPIAQKTHFEFKRGGVSKGHYAVTDKTIYTVDVPGDYVELIFNDSALNFRSLRLAPPAANQPVRLRLRGLHSMGSAASYAPGDELKDFCSFYSLLEPRPKSADWLRVHYVAPAATYASGSQPSPGFYCMGDWP